MQCQQHLELGHQYMGGLARQWYVTLRPANYVNCLLIHAGWQLHQEDMALPAAVLNARADLHRHLSILLCRKPDLASTSDVVLTGLGNARVLQRFKLNTRVALVTGSALTITSFFQLLCCLI